MIHIQTTTKDIQTVVQDLTSAVEKHHYGVLHVHDLQASMRKKGIDFAKACQILEVCNPHHAATILDGDMRISLALPCRISVYKEDGRTKIGTLLPTRLMEGFQGGPEMMVVAREVEGDILAIIAEAL